MGRYAARNDAPVNYLKIGDYFKILISAIRNTFFYLIPFIVLIFIIEVLFDLFDGNSIKVFFTLDFMIHFLFHQLMFILYFIVFLFSLISSIVLFIRRK